MRRTTDVSRVRDTDSRPEFMQVSQSAVVICRCSCDPGARNETMVVCLTGKLCVVQRSVYLHIGGGGGKAEMGELLLPACCCRVLHTVTCGDNTSSGFTSCATPPHSEFRDVLE
ncbi:hypothetical protein TRVL_10281 [Trypanosoma vivax]|nr:hypothetical protein TRVL_10281 [Trypanosoma vivax]